MVHWVQTWIAVMDIQFSCPSLSPPQHHSNLSDNDRANLQALLYAVITKLKYDEGYNFLSEVSEDKLRAREQQTVHDGLSIICNKAHESSAHTG